jgi:hypothetical protein
MGNSHESKKVISMPHQSCAVPEPQYPKSHVIRAPTTDILENEAMSIENAKWKKGIQTAQIWHHCELPLSLVIIQRERKERKKERKKEKEIAVGVSRTQSFT